MPASPAAAKAAALAFMRELGMRDPVAGSFRATGSATGEVTIHPRREDGRPLARPTTWVQLHRYTNGWVVTGARARNAIEVEQPRAFARISSPVTVSGLANAYEGTVNVAVMEDRRGADRVLGKGFVTGGAVELAPFSGRIAFVVPSADAGWLIFSGGTGVDDGISDAFERTLLFEVAVFLLCLLLAFLLPDPRGRAPERAPAGVAAGA